MGFKNIIIYLLAIFSLTVTLLPLLPFRHWLNINWDFPRIHLLLLLLFLIGALFLTKHYTAPLQIILIFLLFIAAIYHGSKIYPYTTIAPKESQDAKNYDPEDTISFLMANVLISNRNAHKIRNLIASENPDVVLLVETDKWWIDEMASLEKNYPYSITYPMDNTFGISLYSKLKLVEPEIKFLIDNQIPSIHTWIEASPGRLLKFYGVHPQAPLPGFSQDNDDEVENRDLELLLVGKDAKKQKGPVIVLGDLNDVAWSRLTSAFQKMGRLLDPRKGRGMYNTFHADYFFLRFPIDHIFHTRHFKVVKLKRLGHIDSDHFPIFAILSLEPVAGNDPTP